jgi:NAD-dependent deacetylase
MGSKKGNDWSIKEKGTHTGTALSGIFPTRGLPSGPTVFRPGRPRTSIRLKKTGGALKSPNRKPAPELNMNSSCRHKTQSIDPLHCARMMEHARSVVALTGAGISTAAGIPDFRGPRGLYVTRRYDPEKVFEVEWFRRAPQYFYEFSHDFIATVKTVRPTFTHRFLTDLEKKGVLAGIITQNIDMLHQLAGTRTLVELHGSYSSATCTACGRRFQGLTYTWWEKAMASSPTPPVAFCAVCHGVLKPGIVFFGEMVNGFGEAERMVARCDLLLVLGSSLRVSPASLLPYGTEAPTIVVNRGEVALTPAPNRFFIEGGLDAFCRELWHDLGTG